MFDIYFRLNSGISANVYRGLRVCAAANVIELVKIYEELLENNV